jgi:hypothetical protein
MAGISTLNKDDINHLKRSIISNENEAAKVSQKRNI